MDIGTDTGASDTQGTTEGRRLTDAEFDPSIEAGTNAAQSAPAVEAAGGVSIVARFEAEIARAAAVGRRLAQAGSSLMSTLPPGSTDTEIGLHLIHENVSRFEKAVRTLELTMEELPSSNGD